MVYSQLVGNIIDINQAFNISQSLALESSLQVVYTFHLKPLICLQKYLKGPEETKKGCVVGNDLQVR